jgi:septal ring factor EnvC (AmiA/AmiB activator)
MNENENWETIVASIAALPETSNQRAAAIAALANIKEGLERKHRLLTLVQEALSQLRLDLKYLIFDLESTRRERDELKEKLGE